MQITISKAEYDRLHHEISYLKEQLAQINKMLFGQKSERFIAENADQLSLAIDVNEIPVTKERIEIPAHQKNKKKVLTPHGREDLPDHLPRNDIYLEPEENTTGMKKIGEEITEELDYKKATLVVNRYIRPKYIKDSSGERTDIIIAPLPPRPIEGGIPSAKLLAHILISKYVDHLPLHRQLKIFRRLGFSPAESTINGWVKQSCERLELLYDCLKQDVFSKNYLMVDETSIKVLKQGKAKGKNNHLGYFWVYHDPLGGSTWFDYHPSRGKAVPQNRLEHYSGYLQTDGYAAYDQFNKMDGITMLACMAHARRKFKEALDKGYSEAEPVLKLIQKLYRIERETKELSDEARFAVREKYSLPVLDEIHTRLLKETAKPNVPKHPVTKAVNYMLNQWDALKAYTHTGYLKIDNNPVESCIRPVALGRKNYLFAGSDKGAKWAAMIYSLVSSAKNKGLCPSEYLSDALNRINEHPYKKLKELLP